MSLEPSRIVRARRRAGISKKRLADLIGATPRTISNYETRGAPDALAATLADVLNVDPTFFSMPATSPLEEDRVFFRARRRTSAAVRHAASEAGRTGVEFYSLIAEHFKLPEVDLPDLVGMGPAIAARQLRAHWKVGAGPLPNLIQLAESRGLRVMSLPGTTDEVDAFSVWEKGVPYIFLSQRKTAERSRFDLAHEIGHLVLHSGLGNGDSVERDAEREADAFASEFLLPGEVLRGAMPRQPSTEAVLKAKVSFGVSAMAMAYALFRNGLLSEWAHRQMCIDLTRRGYRASEPGGIHRETSRVFSLTLSLARQRLGLGTEEIAQALGVCPQEIHELTFGHAVTPVASVGGSSAAPEPGPRPSLRVV